MHISLSSSNKSTKAYHSSESTEIGLENECDNCDERAGEQASLSDEFDDGVCVDRWRNAGSEARKRMFHLFAASGIFVALCRHGHLLVMCDMIRSGELYVFFCLFFRINSFLILG